MEEENEDYFRTDNAASLGLSFALTLDVPVDANGWQLNTRNGNQALIMSPGAPELPFYPAKVLLPFGMKVENVQVELEELELVRSNVRLGFVRTPQPTSLPTPDNTIPDPALWNSDKLYPDKDLTFWELSFTVGFSLHSNIYPWRYNPVTQQIYAAKSIRIT